MGCLDVIMFEIIKLVWFYGVVVYGFFIEQFINIYVKIIDVRLIIIGELGQIFESVELKEMYDVFFLMFFEIVFGL